MCEDLWKIYQCKWNLEYVEENLITETLMQLSLFSKMLCVTNIDVFALSLLENCSWKSPTYFEQFIRKYIII